MTRLASFAIGLVLAALIALYVLSAASAPKPFNWDCYRLEHDVFDC